MIESAIESHGLSKWFGEVVALNNLDVAVQPGITGLLGPNGAGKTTFIKLALGLYAPSRGELKVLGEPPRNNLRTLARIGYCPESDKFYDNMTGFEFVYWMNRFSGMTRKAAREKAVAACERVKIAGRMHDPIDEYSRGMRQRIKLAQALASDPELLFLDEPMSGLDPEGREDLYCLIRDLAVEGRTIIFSSHVLHEVERLTSNVLLLHRGFLLAQGDIKAIRELIDEHPHAVTVHCRDPRAVAAQYVGDPSTLSVEFAANAVTIRTKDPSGFYAKLNELILAGHMSIAEYSCPDDNLQSVFNYLVK
jgi:ABC-2 type transport system ATP-binding protein